MISTLSSLCLAVVTALGMPVDLEGKLWPQWRGPERNGISRETGLLDKWPDAGPPFLWEATEIGDGFSTVSIAGGRVFTQGNVGGRTFVFALDLKSGKQVWSVPNGEAYKNSYGDGPRSTPTIDGEVLYALNAQGDLLCLETAAGKEVWKLNILKEFKANNIGWGISESPLIAGELLICTPGGKDATLAALEKKTGKTVWTSKGLSDQAAYASPITFKAAGVEQVVNVTSKGVASVALKDGNFLWRYDRAANGTANVATPIYHDGKVFVTSAYDTGCALIALGEESGGKVTAKEVYFSRDMQNHHGGVVLVERHLYGFSGGTLTCMEWETGKVAWKNRSVGKGSIVYADGCLYVVSEDGTVGLVEATPEAYRERSRFKIEHGSQHAWAHPVVAGGRLFIRTQGKLRSYDVGGRSAAGG